MSLKSNNSKIGAKSKGCAVNDPLFSVVEDLFEYVMISKQRQIILYKQTATSNLLNECINPTRGLTLSEKILES